MRSIIAEHNEIVLSQFEQFLTQIDLSPKTITNYLADLNVFTRWAEAEYAPQFFLIKVLPEQIRAYRRFMVEEQGRVYSTANRHLQAIRKFCAYITQANLAPNNAAEEIPLFTAEEQRPPEIIKAENLAQLVNAANVARLSIAKRDTTILHLLAYVGLRVGELIDLHTDDVIFDHPGVHLKVRDSRGQGTRDIPLATEQISALKEWLVIRPSTSAFPQVFLSQEGRPISARTVQRIVSRCAKAAGLKGVTAQLLRRTYAMNLLAQTNDLDLVRERLGHQNQKVTVQYLNL